MTSLLKLRIFDVIFDVSCELFQPIGKTEFSSTAKNRTNSISWVRNNKFNGNLNLLLFLNACTAPQHILK